MNMKKSLCFLLSLSMVALVWGDDATNDVVTVTSQPVPLDNQATSMRVRTPGTTETLEISTLWNAASTSGTLTIAPETGTPITYSLESGTREAYAWQIPADAKGLYFLTYTDGVVTYSTQYWLGDDHSTTTESEAAASVNGSYYSTIEGAVVAATAGQTVTILKDNQRAVSCPISAGITIDYNGYTVLGPQDGSGVAFTVADGVEPIFTNSKKGTGGLDGMIYYAEASNPRLVKFSQERRLDNQVFTEANPRKGANIESVEEIALSMVWNTDSTNVATGTAGEFTINRKKADGTLEAVVTTNIEAGVSTVFNLQKSKFGGDYVLKFSDGHEDYEAFYRFPAGVMLIIR